MKRLLAFALFASLTGLASTLFAGGLPEDAKDAPRFGPYKALTFDKSIIHDVKVESDGDVYLQLLPDHKDKELVVKISNDYFASYREWMHGGYELVSPANQGRPSYGWTDYVNTGARFIEYWMDGKVFLHLQRVD